MRSTGSALTTIAAATVIYDLLSLMANTPTRSTPELPGARAETDRMAGVSVQ